jgi:hypothetical protein
MKKLFLLVSALALATACAAPETPAPSANANVSSSPAAVAMTEAGAMANEKAIWDSIKTKDYVAFENMLAAEQLEVTGESVNDKAQSSAMVKDFEPTEVVYSDWKFMSIDPTAYVITYKVDMKGKYKGKDFPPMSGRASSAWVNQGGKWLAIYHQETPVNTAPAAPATAKKTPAATAAASPAAPAPVPATGSDPSANEKIVWDLFKAKNYDGFASLLDPAFIEVESDKVYDKAASVEAVQNFDASKAVLSDWKSATLNSKTALTTYVAKMPGMKGDGERHATIWAERNGKWVALFHQGGTPVMKPSAATPSPAASASPKTAASPAAAKSPATAKSPAAAKTP